MALLEQVIIQLHSSKKKNHLSLVALLDCLTFVMAPITYLEGLIKLLKVSDNDIRRKVTKRFTGKKIAFCCCNMSMSCSISCNFSALVLAELFKMIFFA